MGADMCGLKGGETVAVWGAGPVGLFAMKSCMLLGAQRVIAIDNVPHRLAMAARECGASPLNFDDVHVLEALDEMTGGRGPDCCIDACGMEAHAANLAVEAYDRIKQSMRLQTDRPHVAREAIMACRKGGTVVIMGVYTLFVDKFPLGVAFNKGLRLAMGQMHGPRYIPRLLEYTQKGEVDPAFCFTHVLTLDQTPQAYELFKNRDDGCVKVLIKP
jgi:threonine dehydrogenase-like Zn-dependent dehydrogenase